MDEHKVARGIGWVSIGVGLALVVAPTQMTKGFGMGERPNLGRFLGVRDLVLGAGLLRGESLAPWPGPSPTSGTRRYSSAARPPAPSRAARRWSASRSPRL